MRAQDPSEIPHPQHAHFHPLTMGDLTESRLDGELATDDCVEIFAALLPIETTEATANTPTSAIFLSMIFLPLM